MIPQRLFETLRCPICYGRLKEYLNPGYEKPHSDLLCTRCFHEYSVLNNIPSVIKSDPENEIWNTWKLDKVKMTGDSYYKRSIGELPEKEASKSFANFMLHNNIYNIGDSILDFGCATGHFLRSFRNILGNDILYTGVDSHFEFLQWGAKAYGIDDTCNFVHCDVLDLPFMNNSFDISVINLFHFFPNIVNALREAIRVTKKYIVWRTPIGNNANYMIKIIMNDSFDKLGLLTYDLEDIKYDLYMLYTKKYINKLVENLGAKVSIIQKDTDFKQFDNTSLPEFEHIPATKTIGDCQVNGNLVLDWHYFVIDCGGR